MPFATFGIVFDGRRLSTCSFRRSRIAVLAAEMSAHESGKTVADVAPLSDVIVKVILGAGSVAVT